MSYGYYSLNDLTPSGSGIGSSTIVNAINPVDSVFNASTDTYTISLFENPTGTINFSSFNKGLSTTSISANTGVFNVIYTNSITGPVDLRGPTGPQGHIGPTGSQGHIGPTGPSPSISDPFVVNNLIVHQNITGATAIFSGYVVGQNLIATNTIAGPICSCEEGQFPILSFGTGSVSSALDFNDWIIHRVADTQLEVIHKNNNQATMLFVQSLQNGYILANDILPFTNSKNLGSVGSRWNEIHCKKLFVDTNTIEFQQPTGSASGANSYLKSEYINVSITGPLGEINLNGNNVFTDYISATGGFFDYTTSLVSTTVELSAKDIYVENLQGFSRSMTGICNSGAGLINPILSITGSNIGGIINLTTSTGCQKNYSIVEIDFLYSFQHDPSVILQPANQASARLLGDSNIFVETSPTKFIIYSGNTPLRNNTYYKFYYQIAG